MSEDDRQDKPSKTQRKKAMLQLQELGETLVALPGEKLRRLDLPSDLLDAITEAQRIKKHGAKRRQIQYIGKLMRQVDAQTLQIKLETLLRR